MTDKTGSVWADNIEDRESEESIRYGYITGDGLLGDVARIALRLQEIGGDIGYGGLLGYPDRNLDELREELYLELYNTLKKIEQICGMEERPRTARCNWAAVRYRIVQSFRNWLAAVEMTKSG